MIFHPSLKNISEHVGSGAPDANPRLKQHLDRCEKCRNRYNVLRGLDTALEPRAGMPEDFSKSLIQKLPAIEKDNRIVLGELKAVIGNALLFKGNEEEGTVCFPDMLLRAGDYIKLNGNAKALIQLNDGSSIYLNKDTELSLETANRYNLKMYSGELFAMMKPQKERFRIKTPSAELSVIGTEFNARITKDNETILRVKKGRVAYKNSSGETVAGRKQQIKAAPDKKPAASRLEDDRSISNWTDSINPTGKGGNKNNMPKKIIGLVLTLAIIIAGYLIYKHFFKPLQPESQQADSNAAFYSPYSDPNEETNIKQALFKITVLEMDLKDIDYLESRFPGFKNNIESIGMFSMNNGNDKDIIQKISEELKKEGLVEKAGVISIATINNGESEINMQRDTPIGNRNNLTIEGIGLKLKFTPQIEPDNYITLKINSEYSYLEDSIVPSSPKKVSRQETNTTIKIMKGQLLAIRCMQDKAKGKYMIALIYPDVIE